MTITPEGEGRIAVLIPVMRPHLVRALVDNIAQATRSDHRTYLMTHQAETVEFTADQNVTCWRDEQRSWGHRLNEMYTRTIEPYIFLGAEDVRFWPAWDVAALAAMDRMDGVVAVADHMNPAGTLALVSRRYIDTMGGTTDDSGYVIHSGYHHNFSESELFATAKARGRFRFAPEAVVEHRHYSGHSVTKLPHDEVYALGQSTWGADAALFESRSHLWSTISK